jgi:hypothetical protein
METINKRWLKNRLNEYLLVKADEQPINDGDDWSKKPRPKDKEWLRYVDVKDLYPYNMIEDKLNKTYYKLRGDKEGEIRLFYMWCQAYTFKISSVSFIRDKKLKDLGI